MNLFIWAWGIGAWRISQAGILLRPLPWQPLNRSERQELESRVLRRGTSFSTSGRCQKFDFNSLLERKGGPALRGEILALAAPSLTSRAWQRLAINKTDPQT